MLSVLASKENKDGDRIVSATLHDEGDEGPILEIIGNAGLGTKYYEDEGFHSSLAVFLQ